MGELRHYIFSPTSFRGGDEAHYSVEDLLGFMKLRRFY
jgi:hypothetical protein